jgi:hypothetical protein
VLRALLETFISRAWSLCQPSDGATLLTFPSYFRCERKEQPQHPSELAKYRFDGSADEITQTLGGAAASHGDISRARTAATPSALP